MKLFQEKKLVAPEISYGGNFSFDKKGGFYSTTTVYGYIKKEETNESYKSLLAILNSHLFWWYLVNTGAVLANGYFRYKPDYIYPFPVPELLPKEIENKIEFLVNKILNSKNSNIDNNQQKNYQEIDNILYKLYDLTNEEIEIIESIKPNQSEL